MELTSFSPSLKLQLGSVVSCISIKVQAYSGKNIIELEIFGL